MSGFPRQDGRFLEDFDCSTVISVRVNRLKEKEKKRSCAPCLYFQSGGLVFHQLCTRCGKRLRFPQEARRGPQEDEAGVKQRGGENDKGQFRARLLCKIQNQPSLLCKINK